MGALFHRAWDRPRTRLLVVGVAAALVVAVALVWWFVWRSPDAGAATVKQVTRTATVSTTTIEKSVSATGTLTPSVQDDVSFGASGTVTAVDVAEGDTVKKGEVLATVDTLQLKADLLSAKADLATATANLTTAEDADDGTDAAAAQVTAKKGQVEVAQASVDSARTAMDDSTLKAPAAGLVTEVNVTKGDAVTGTASSSSSSGSGTGSGSSGSGSSGSGSGSSGSSSASGTSGQGSSSSSSTSSSSAQFVIVGTSSWGVSVNVGEDDVAHVKKGEQVELTGDDLSSTVYGTVSTVGLLPSTTSGSVTYPVTVKVTGSPKGLYDGVSVTAAIVYERRSDVLAVPAAAVTTTDGKSTVQLVGSDGGATQTAVTVGETSGQMVEITQGLTEGQTVQYTQVVSTGGTRSGNQEQGQFPGGGEGFGGGEGGTGRFGGGEGGGQGGGTFGGGQGGGRG